MIFNTVLLLGIAFAKDPNYEGSCVTGRIDFKDTSRIFGLDAVKSVDTMKHIEAIDNTRYDFTIDYAVKQASVKNGVATLSLPKPGPNGEIQGTRMSSTRLLKYGKVTMQMRASTIPGIVSTFILMGGKLPDEYDAKSPNRKFGDEIDFEFLGQHPNIAETNVFYRNFPEFGARLQQLKVDDISKTHKYTIDWKPDVIDYAVDDVVLRSYRRDSPLANSPNINPGDRFFPNRPQKIQFGLWADPKNSWSGPLVFPPGVNEATVSYDFIDIQCYNDKGEPVDKWPAATPPRRATVPGQPTLSVNGTIPEKAGFAAGGSNATGNSTVSVSTTTAASVPATLTATIGTNTVKSTASSIATPTSTSGDSTFTFGVSFVATMLFSAFVF